MIEKDNKILTMLHLVSKNYDKRKKMFIFAAF